MPSISDIRRGIAANLAAVRDEIEITTISPFVISNPQTPCLEVEPFKARYDTLIRTDELRFKVRAIVGFVVTETAQETLDALLEPAGPGSVKEAIEANPTLGGLVDDTTVEESTGYRYVKVDGHAEPALGCEWTVCVEATR